MGNLTDAMRRLREDIIASYDARMATVDALAKEAKEMLGGFRDEHREMAEALKAALSQGESARLDEFKALLDGIRTRQKEREGEVSALLRETEEMLGRFRDEHKEMAEALKAALSQGESARLDEFKALLGSIQARQKEREGEVSALLRETKEMLGRFSDEHREMAKAWRNMAATMAQRMAAVSPKAEERAREEAERAAARAEALRNRIVAVANKNPDGIKLSEIGESLGVAWQGVIPIVGALVEEGQIGKKGRFYYPVSE